MFRKLTLCLLMLSIVSCSAAAAVEENSDLTPSQELDLSLSDYVAQHTEWTLTPIDRVGEFSGEAVDNYVIDGVTYTIKQCDLENGLIVKPAGGTFRELSQEDLQRYKIEDTIFVKIRLDRTGVEYCVQHLTGEGLPTLEVVTFQDGAVAHNYCSIGGRPEMDFALVAYADSQGLYTTVRDLHNKNNDNIRGRDYFKSHLQDTVSVVYQLS